MVFGYVSLDEKTGQYQFYAELMEPSGVGQMQAEFVEVRDRLQAEGLFDDRRKKPIPATASCVAVITSPTGAAVHDIIKTMRSRNPAARIVIAPALVQGEEAARDIVRAVREVNEWGGADVIILGRGGGSAEDLWVFNKEEVARAIAESKIPVISAVGHETDFTIADFAADLRAATPTAAAVIAAYDYYATLARVKSLTDLLHKSVEKAVGDQKTALSAVLKNRFFRKPLDMIYERQTHLEGLIKELSRLLCGRLSKEHSRLERDTALLHKVSPEAIWKRGFAVVRGESGGVVTSASALGTGEKARLQFSDGQAVAVIGEVTLKSK
ncbi:MAG: exodeoxyribonuclease VII large subunit [Clostridiales bacterium]|nr:exodeoxyribonuclease VII large subunit [Clostridiales bacterium]